MRLPWEDNPVKAAATIAFPPTLKLEHKNNAQKYKLFY